MSRSPLLTSLTAAGALAVLAGAPVSAVAQPQAMIVGRALLLNGQPIYTSQGRISNQRVFTFAGSPSMMVTWEEQTRDGKVTSFAYSRDGRVIDQIGATENKVRLRYAAFDPAAGEPMVAGELAAGEHNQLYLVQFVATPLEEMRREIGLLGGKVLRFMTDNTHVIKMTPDAMAQVQALPYVRWVGAYHPAYRLDEGVRAALLGGGRMAAVRYSIECMEIGQQQALADLIVKSGGILDFVIGDQYRLEATLNREQLLAVAASNDVNFIDYSGAPYGADMNLIRQTGGAVPLLSGLNMLGQGVRGEVFDGGCIPNHQQWNGQTPLVRTTQVTDSHGTACYGINFATGTGNANLTGLLPMREQGIISRYQDTNQTGLGTGSITRLSLNTGATDPTGNFRSSYQTSSVGSPRVLSYTTVSAEVDDYLFRVDYLSFQSQSNAGGTRDSRPQAWAKNIVSVGGMNLQETIDRNDDIWDNGASVGPSNDLRVKPDLAHSFGSIFTTDSGSTTATTQFGGTSGATPITAGHAGLLMQMWHEGVFQGFGGGSSVFASRPHSATAKALLINGAHRATANTTNRLYRAYVGWGMADLVKLYNDRAKFFIVNANDPLVNGQTRTHDLFVQAGEPEFRVTMIYPDPMGNPTAAQQRINDLTLKVTSPTGTVYWGNNGMVPTAITGTGQLAGANYTAPGGSANTYDTVENVFIQNPEGGMWTVQVIASQVVQDGYLATPALDAVYALVASNVTLGPPPPTGACCLPDAPCTIMGEANCMALNGTYRGDNTQCATANCPPVGACCLGNGTCLGMSEAACATAGGAYRGDNTVCATANCSGACCLPSGACDITGGPSCLAAGGIYRGDGSVCATANCPLPPGVWIEQGDAGEMPATAQVTLGTGALTQIRGDASPGNDIDMFRISVCDRTVFSATTVNGAEWDTQLFLFTTAGMGVVCNDDSTGLQSTLTNQLVANNGQYYIAISRYNRDPISAGGLIFGTGTQGQIGPTGPGGTQPITGWNNSATGSTYTIFFTGTCYAETPPAACYANCDASTTVPFLNVADFGCFLGKFAAGDTYANCDGSTTPPVLNVADFGCFLTKFAAGCSAP